MALNRKGRVPGKGNVTIDEAFLKKVEELAAKGCSCIAIANALGIAESTFHKHKKKEAAVREAMKLGQGKAVLEVESALFRDAQAGNTTAQIFFLKNRCPEEWKDRHEVEAKVNVNLDEELNDARKRKEALQLKRQQDNTEGKNGQVSEYVRH